MSEVWNSRRPIISMFCKCNLLMKHNNRHCPLKTLHTTQLAHHFSLQLRMTECFLSCSWLFLMENLQRNSVCYLIYTKKQRTGNKYLVSFISRSTTERRRQFKITVTYFICWFFLQLLFYLTHGKIVFHKYFFTHILFQLFRNLLT